MWAGSVAPEPHQELLSLCWLAHSGAGALTEETDWAWDGVGSVWVTQAGS